MQYFSIGSIGELQTGDQWPQGLAPLGLGRSHDGFNPFDQDIPILTVAQKIYTSLDDFGRSSWAYRCRRRPSQGTGTQYAAAV